MARSLSARLDAVLSLLLPCQLLADVGTDHGLIPVAAVQRGVALRAIASDLREAPLAIARGNIAREGVAQQVTALMGDGLVHLEPYAVDAVVMAGMSGELMVRLLERAPRVLAGLAQLVLCANQDADAVRAWALARGLHLRDERMVEERGYFFPICAFQPGQGADPRYTLDGFTLEELHVLGPVLLARRDPTALRAYQEQRDRLGKLVRGGVHARAAELCVWQKACDALQG